MASSTLISWCHHTHNAWEGCEKISPGCKNCYAAAMNKWLRKGENWGPASPRRFFGPDHWKKPLTWNAAAKRDGVRRRVFINSISDVFEIHSDRDVNADLNSARERLWDLILSCSQLDWLLLTKRIENATELLPWPSAFSAPFRNVWIGVTAEDQECADKRIPILRRVGAAVRFVSYEPALGPIDWRAHLEGAGRPDWVIFGDESGRNRRDADPEWARRTRDACAAANVAYHFKQWCGDNEPGIEGARTRRKIHLPILDGVQHAAFPEVRS